MKTNGSRNPPFEQLGKECKMAMDLRTSENDPQNREMVGVVGLE